MSEEKGFTLVELLVTSAILGIIIAAIAAAIIIGLRTTDETHQRLAESHDAQLVAAYFVSDVQSADDVSTSDTTCAGVTPLVRLRWTDAGVTKIASYVVGTVSGQRRLTRKYCENGTIVSEVAVAHFLHPTTSPTLGCPPPTPCASTSTEVVITVTDESDYSYSLTGRRRALG